MANGEGVFNLCKFIWNTQAIEVTLDWEVQFTQGSQYPFLILTMD